MERLVPYISSVPKMADQACDIGFENKRNMKIREVVALVSPKLAAELDSDKKPTINQVAKVLANAHSSANVVNSACAPEQARKLMFPHYSEWAKQKRGQIAFSETEGDCVVNVRIFRENGEIVMIKNPGYGSNQRITGHELKDLVELFQKTEKKAIVRPIAEERAVHAAQPERPALSEDVPACAGANPWGSASVIRCAAQ
jgi:hypothetical protein